MASVESIHNKIIEKISLLDKLLSMDKKNKKDFEHIHRELSEISNTYDIHTAGHIVAYYKAVSVGDTEATREADSKYLQTVSSHGIVNKLDHIIRTIENYKISKISHITLDSARSIKIIIEQPKRIFDDCPSCKSKMKIIPEESQLRCYSCGAIVTLLGTVFEEAQFYNQDSQYSKHKTYDPNKHCIKWIHQIQANESKRFPDEHIDLIRDRMNRDYFAKNSYDTGDFRRKPVGGITCAEVRKWLKECGLSRYNDHAPLIRKILTGITPYKMEYDLEQKVLMLFSKAMDIFEDLIRHEKRQNKLYYPYVLFKILCQKSKKFPQLTSLLGCIHLQSESTLIKNDIIWKKICDRMPDDLVYEPTDKSILIRIKNI